MFGKKSMSNILLQKIMVKKSIQKNTVVIKNDIEGWISFFLNKESHIKS